MIDKSKEELPGPGEYMSEKSIQYLKDKDHVKINTAFASNQNRFKEQEVLIPGPGKY